MMPTHRQQPASVCGCSGKRGALPKYAATGHIHGINSVSAAGIRRYIEYPLPDQYRVFNDGHFVADRTNLWCTGRGYLQRSLPGGRMPSVIGFTEGHCNPFRLGRAPMDGHGCQTACVVIAGTSRKNDQQAHQADITHPHEAPPHDTRRAKYSTFARSECFHAQLIVAHSRPTPPNRPQ